jgi:hypothetical protein
MCVAVHTKFHITQNCISWDHFSPSTNIFMSARVDRRIICCVRRFGCAFCIWASCVIFRQGLDFYTRHPPAVPFSLSPPAHRSSAAGRDTSAPAKTDAGRARTVILTQTSPPLPPCSAPDADSEKGAVALRRATAGCCGSPAPV